MKRKEYIALAVTILILFFMGTCCGQDFIDSDSFKSKIAKNIVCVEFWAKWNASNEFAELTKLKECDKYRVDISVCNKIQKEYSVVVIPTIIIFDNGEEKERFGPNIMFQLNADKKTIQHSVDTLTLNRFQ
jgi:thiol-disulfide isomerase/thioredoxin